MEFPALAGVVGSETFSFGWSGNEDDLAEFGASDLTAFVFEGSLLFETFDWFPFQGEIGAITAVTFNGAGTPSAFEPFDFGWSGNENDTLALTALTDHIGEETFDTGWKNNQLDVTTLGPLTLMTVGQGGTAETFSPFSPVFSEYLIGPAVVGEAYQINVNGLPCVYVAQGGDTPTDIATQLAACVDNLPLLAGGASIGDRVQVTNTSSNAEPFTTSSGGTTPGNCVEVFDGAVQPDVSWTGKSANNCI
jgi:hypothetical protein